MPFTSQAQPFHTLPTYAGEDNLGVVPGTPPLVRDVIRNNVRPQTPVTYPARARAPNFQPVIVAAGVVGLLAFAFSRVR